MKLQDEIQAALGPEKAAIVLESIEALAELSLEAEARFHVTRLEGLLLARESTRTLEEP